VTSNIINTPSKSQDLNNDGMKTHQLRYHSRPITWLCFNSDGNLLFTCGKDTLVGVWSVSKSRAELLGVYEGHSGAVWSCDITRDSKYLVTGAADQRVICWDASSTSMICEEHMMGVVKFVEWHREENRIAVCVNSFGKSSAAHIMTVKFDGNKFDKEQIIFPRSPALQARWYENRLCSCHEDGSVLMWDVERGKIVFQVGHKEAVNRIEFRNDLLALASASGLVLLRIQGNDGEKLIEVETDRPLNDVCLTDDVISVGGGQDARDVALKNVQAENQFEPILYKMTQDEDKRITLTLMEERFRNHFGPIHCVAMRNNFVASGSEDGMVHCYTR